MRLFNLHEDDEGLPLANCVIEYKPRAERDLWLTDARKVRGRLRWPIQREGISTICGALLAKGG